MYFPHQTLFTSQGHKCQGERGRFISEKEAIQEEEELDRGTRVVPSRKRRQNLLRHKPSLGGADCSMKSQLFQEPICLWIREKRNRGPGDFEFGTGMRNKVQIYANAVKYYPSAFQHVKRGGDTCRPRSAESSGKGCYRNLFLRSKSIYFQHFHHPEEGWGEKANGRHARTELVCRVSSIQDGGYITAERYPTERRLHDKAGSSRPLLDYYSGSKIKDLFKIFLEGRALSVHMSTIRPLSISKVVYQDTEASDCLSNIYGDSFTNLLR